MARRMRSLAGGEAGAFMARGTSALPSRTSALSGDSPARFAWVTCVSCRRRLVLADLRSLGHSSSDTISRIASPPVMPTKRSMPGMMLVGRRGSLDQGDDEDERGLGADIADAVPADLDVHADPHGGRRSWRATRGTTSTSSARQPSATMPPSRQPMKRCSDRSATAWRVPSAAVGDDRRRHHHRDGDGHLRRPAAGRSGSRPAAR